jgi:transcription antitermination protein NusB
MESRRKFREWVVQVLFAFDAQGAASDEAALEMTLRAGADHEVAGQVVKASLAAWENRKAADDWVTRLAPQWPTHRQPAVDRAILRMSLWELTHDQTPPKVVLDEAIEIARSFSTENSPSFINGVLDAVLKEMTNLKAGPTQERAPETAPEKTATPAPES